MYHRYIICTMRIVSLINDYLIIYQHTSIQFIHSNPILFLKQKRLSNTWNPKCVWSSRSVNRLARYRVASDRPFN